jgi:carbon-monoxide dehydrogenase large subunit
LGDHPQKSGEGVGAGVSRKEDRRHLHGRGTFVSDMVLEGQQEVAFLRSPIAHGHIRGIIKPKGKESCVFTSADTEGLKPIVASSTLAGRT